MSEFAGEMQKSRGNKSSKHHMPAQIKFGRRHVIRPRPERVNQTPASNGDSEIKETLIERIGAVTEINGVNERKSEDAVEKSGGSIKVRGIHEGVF